MSVTDQTELKRMASTVVTQAGGIWEMYETFYIVSITDAAKRALDAFHRYEVAKTLKDTAAIQVSALHEALDHCAALSRFFWPSNMKKDGNFLKQLKDARSEKLRKAFFSPNVDSPLANRQLRDALEHFDERLDKYLLTLDPGNVFPEPNIGDLDTIGPLDKVFKMLDPKRMCLVLLGEKHDFGDLRKEVERVYDCAKLMDRNGGRL